MLVWLYRFFALALSASLLVLNLRLYPSQTPEQAVIPQLRYLRTALEAGAGEEMQALFPEGDFFTHVLYGLAWVDVGLRAEPDAALRAEALREARWAWSHLASPRGRAPFSEELDPPYGVFYLGWRTWLLGGLLMLQPPAARDPFEARTFQDDCAALAAAFDRSPTPFLAAYPQQAWPVDSVVAVAALRLHDTLFAPRFQATLDRWLEAARHKVDSDTGLLPHQVHPHTGQVLQGARGASQSIIARFLIEVDEAWGRKQYARFRAAFVAPFLGVPGAREYPSGRAGRGDVDSGPLLAGFSASATVVTLAAAQVHGDRDVVEALIPASEAVGLPFEWNGQKRYALGLLPVGDAFLAWAKASRPWVAAYREPPRPVIAPPNWRWPFHLVTLMILLGVWSPVLARWLKKKQPATNGRG